ncbi:MAG: Stp1/IreP family PP2C-type Ser/Thr phosphatase [Candidatus Zixiibacteriota bacterium]
MPLQFKVAGRSDVGLVRGSNEDCLHLDDANGVFAVCDGMGGHQAGEVASMMAADIIDIVFNDFKQEFYQDKRLALDKPLPYLGQTLLKAIRVANRAIFNKAVEKQTLMGMGTTIVALVLEKDTLSIAHVGDSRAYRLLERSIEPLTIDHSWIAEVQQSQNISEQEAASVVGKNVITRALGVRDTVEVDYRMVKVKPGDKFMICSDGLCGFADDEDIFSVINKVRKDNERIVEDLIQMANDRGGADNVTVAVVEVVDVEESELGEVDRFTLPEETPPVLEAEDLWIERINEFIAHRTNPVVQQTVAARPVRKSALVLIFAVFIIIAAVMIYLSTSR